MINQVLPAELATPTLCMVDALSPHNPAVGNEAAYTRVYVVDHTLAFN